MDCMDYMSSFPDKYFDLAVVDPPYGINAPNMQLGTNPNRKGKNQYPSESTASRIKKSRLNSGGGQMKNSALVNMDCDWDMSPPGPEYFIELFRCSKNQIIFGGNYFPLPPTRCIICWDKMQPWDNFSQWEMAWTSFDKPAKMYRISNTGGSNKEKRIHPTQKPVIMYDKIFEDFAVVGMKILDTHLGSGSSRISAWQLGIDFYSTELSWANFKAQEERFAMVKCQSFLFQPTLEKI